MTRTRWWIVLLLFFATTINYLDRILFSVLIPVIRSEMHINDQEYGYINGAFQIAYTVGFLLMGKLIDGYGTRIGYTVAVIWWSLAALFHTLASSGLTLGFWRGMLGLGESGNFPSAIKAVAEWFPKQDRALATGWFNAGSNVASMIGPPMFVWMTSALGWRACFAITASLGFLWLAVWLAVYRTPRNHSRVGAEELAYIQSDPPDASQPEIGWKDALRYRQTWGFGLAKFLTDPVWWFYLYWLPPYFYDVRKFDLQQIGWALPFIYLMADFGSVGGGWLSGALMRRGYTNSRARKSAMAVCAGVMPVAACATLVQNPLLAILLLSLATAGHQGWSANLYTTTSDVFPRAATASVTGIGGCLGGLGGFLFSAVIPGYVVTHFGYTPVFMTMGSFHLIAWLVVHLLLRDLRPIENPI